MTDFVESADGTRIAYDLDGEGPAVILVAGAIQFRAFDPGTARLARALASEGHTVVTYDRRGRGESTDAPTYAVEREVEDIAALLEVTGGGAALFGNCSGGVLALWAAAAGLPVTRLALWEPPLAPEGQRGACDDLRTLQRLWAAGDRAGMVEHFLRDMPEDWLDEARRGPAWPIYLEVAHTLVYDSAVVERAGHAPWAQQWAGVSQPTLVLVGESTVPSMPPIAEALVRALPNATAATLPGRAHRWSAEVMAERLGRFLSSTPAPNQAFEALK